MTKITQNSHWPLCIVGKLENNLFFFSIQSGFHDFEMTVFDAANSEQEKIRIPCYPKQGILNTHFI